MILTVLFTSAKAKPGGGVWCDGVESTDIMNRSFDFANFSKREHKFTSGALGFFRGRCSGDDDDRTNLLPQEVL